MSIVIKDMEMPKSCDDCEFIQRGYPDWCDLSCRSQDVFNPSIRPDWCPIVEFSYGKWIPIKTRQMDEEERVEWSEKLGYDLENDEAVIYTSQLPDDGQEVLTCSLYGTIRTDKFENDPDYGCSFEENGDMDGIVAWMPLPAPWEGE